MTDIFKELINFKITYYNQKYQLLNNNDLVLASFVNPSYKKFSKATDDEKKDLIYRASECIKDYFEANKEKFKKQDTVASTETPKQNCTLSDSDDDNLEKDLDLRMLRNEIKNYATLLKPETNAVDFWKANSSQFPVIFEIFKEHHFVPGTSTPTERHFSHAGEQIWARRNTISTDTVEAIMFLYENQKCLRDE